MIVQRLLYLNIFEGDALKKRQQIRLHTENTQIWILIIMYLYVKFHWKLPKLVLKITDTEVLLRDQLRIS